MCSPYLVPEVLLQPRGIGAQADILVLVLLVIYRRRVVIVQRVIQRARRPDLELEEPRHVEQDGERRDDGDV